MKPLDNKLYKGLLIALLHLLMVTSLGGKLLYDRATRPRVWVKTAPIDPNLPIRGRYVRLRLVMAARGFETQNRSSGYASLGVEDDHLVATFSGNSSDFRVRVWVIIGQQDGQPVVRLNEPLAFFIPEHVEDPSRRKAGEELWVEVTLPKKGPPRPIRLGVKKDGGEIVPLDLD